MHDKIIETCVRPLKWENDRLFVLDQLELPWQESWIEIKSPEEVYDVIVKMNVRGAPLIGMVTAFGLYFKAKELRDCEPENFVKAMEDCAAYLVGARPTAINLAWAAERMTALAREKSDKENRERRFLDEALAIWHEDKIMNSRIAAYGAELFADGARILTHCNTGALATGGCGTALGVIRAVHRRSLDAGKKIFVWIDETRPYLQGSRLTAWEILKEGIDGKLIADNMAAHFMQAGKVDGIVVGADRIATNGDTANKIGTYNLAVLAKYHNIPFYVAAPFTSFDPKARSAADIPIEERSESEVTQIRGQRIAPDGIGAAHPAFDVTPGSLITAIITEKGVFKAPYHFRKN